MLCVLPFEADRSRLARAYASADLFFAPCPYETFGLAALEAMASGLPVVGVAAGGIGRLLVGADRGRAHPGGDAAHCAPAWLGPRAPHPPPLRPPPPPPRRADFTP